MPAKDIHTPAYQVAAINDLCDTCSRCGKADLKRVAWVYRAEEGPAAAVPVGLDCLAVLQGYGKRSGGRVAANAVRRATLDWFVAQWKVFLASSAEASVRVAPGKFLRHGALDYRVVVEGRTYQSPMEYGMEAALRFAAQEWSREHREALDKEWRKLTGLASSLAAQADWPAEFRGRTPQLRQVAVAL